MVRPSPRSVSSRQLNAVRLTAWSHHLLDSGSVRLWGTYTVLTQAKTTHAIDSNTRSVSKPVRIIVTLAHLNPFCGLGELAREQQHQQYCFAHSLALPDSSFPRSRRSVQQPHILRDREATCSPPKRELNAERFLAAARNSGAAFQRLYARQIPGAALKKIDPTKLVADAAAAFPHERTSIDDRTSRQASSKSHQRRGPTDISRETPWPPSVPRSSVTRDPRYPAADAQ